MGMKMLSVALAAIALGAVTVAPASAAAGNDIVEIKSVAHGDCVQPDSPGAHASPGVGACTGASNQRWERIAVGEGRQLLRNLATTECMSIKFGSYFCDDEGADMFAELVPDPSGAVRVKFGEVYMAGLTFGDGSREIWFPTFRGNEAEELWDVRVVGTTTPPADTTGGVVRIKSVDSTYGCAYLTTDNKLMPLPCGNTPYQKFQRIELADGRTALRSVVTGKCVAPKELQPTEIEVVSDCAPDNTRQHWTIEPTKTGAVRLRQSAGDHYLTPGSDLYFAYPRQRQINTWQLWELQPA